MRTIHVRGPAWSGIGLRGDKVLRYDQKGSARGTDGQEIAVRGGHQLSMRNSGADPELLRPLCISITGFLLGAIQHKIALLGSE